MAAKSMTSREGIADLVRPIVEAEQADLLVGELVERRAGERQDAIRRAGREADPRPK